MHILSVGTKLRVVPPTFWLMGTGGSSSSLPEESEISAGFVLSAGLVGAAVFPTGVLACFGAADFGAGFPWSRLSVFAGAALPERDAVGVCFAGDGTAWEDFGGGFAWTRQEQRETRKTPQERNSFAQTVIKGRYVRSPWERQMLKED